MARDTVPDATQGATHAAGALDIRNFIGGLIGLYGLILTVTGLVSTSDSDLERSGGFHVNLWAGIGMLVAAAMFVAWARLRPVVVPEEDPTERSEKPEGH